MKKKLQQNKQSLSILLLLAMVVSILTVFLLRYYSVEKATCVRHLRGYTEQSAQQVRDSVEHAQNYMNKVSGLIYDAYQTSVAEGNSRLSELGTVEILTRLELLMPDGTVYTHTGPTTDPTLNFSNLSREGTGVLPRSVDQHFSNHYVVRIFTPVRRNGATVAILCGIVDLEQLPYLFPSDAYGGESQFLLVEGRSGGCLADPWHDEPGRLQNFSNYTFLKGDTYQDFYEDIYNGLTGSVLLKNPTTEHKTTLYYTSVGVSDWMVLLAVDHSVAFAQANSILFLFVFMALLLGTISGLFFAWFLWDIHQQQQRTDLRLQGARYMQTVQQTLFLAHVQPKRFGEAMEQVATYLAADATVFFSLNDDGALILTDLSGATDKAPPKHSDLYQLFPQTAKTVMTTGSFSSNRPFLWGERDWQSARELGIRNMMLVRLSAMDGKSDIGVLGAINTDVAWEDASPLEQVALSFSMALANSKNYQALAYMSQVDELTGVLNRNSYETRLEELADLSSGSLGCIYIDANGLHEINNHLGHDAGDEMLRSVADTLRSHFDRTTVFRLGGDEFAVLERSMSKEEMESRIAKIHQTVEKLGYSVSVGLAWQDQGPRAADVVAAAEADMRQKKADYYANQGGQRQLRKLNTQLEQTLAAKKDADSLLSCLVPNFLGVFFVEPHHDSYRSMVVPEDFKGTLERQAKGSYQTFMRLYAQALIVPEDQQRFLEFCDYTTLLHHLDGISRQDALSITYRRTDGQTVLLQVRQPRRAEDNKRETMWIFTAVANK